MKERSMFYEHLAIEKKRSSAKAALITSVEGIRYKEKGTGKCSYCGEAATAQSTLGLVQCSHKRLHKICQACLTKVGGVLQKNSKSIDVAEIRGEDCPCAYIVAKRLMGTAEEDNE